MQGAKRITPSRVRLIGSLIGASGALLDFYSGYRLLTQSGTATANVGMAAQNNGSSMIWGIGISALGVVLAITAIATIPPSMARKMTDFGVLMVVYGVVMLFIGTVMFLGITSMAKNASFPAIGMFLVGGLMVANGALMQRTSMA